MAEKAYLDVKSILSQIGVATGQYVADLGCGAGYFVFPAARLVGPTGRVYALDVQKHVLVNIKQKAEIAGVKNVLTVWSDLEILGAAKIAEASLDFAFFVNLLFQTKKDKDVLREAVRLVKKGGGILVVDWKKEATPFGPPLVDRTSPEEVSKLAQSLGLEVETEFNAGDFHWALVLRK